MFFFSSRRRHTRCLSDWSSDVCSSDLVTGLAQAAAPATPPAVPGEYVRAHYTKYEFRIPMRDGKKLFTAVYVPKDTAQAWRSEERRVGKEGRSGRARAECWRHT